MKIANHKAHEYIAKHLDFNGSNFYGFKSADGAYYVYSYSTLIAKAEGNKVWITTRRYSNTTSKQLIQVRRAFSERDVIHASSLEDAKQTTKWRDLTLALA